MKNQLPNTSLATYFNGWDVALRNYDVFEAESIIQLVRIGEEQLSPETATLMSKAPANLPLTFLSSHQCKLYRGRWLS